MSSSQSNSECTITASIGRHVRDKDAMKPARYVVRGSMAFPIDMLRYDSAWPATERDSHIIEATLRAENDSAVEVVIYARRPLTDGRWASFGWHVRGCIHE